jgi:IclR family acetate operon transcriptional repressor
MELILVTGMALNKSRPVRRRRPKQAKTGDAPRENAGEQYHLKAIARALDVLECFTDERPNLNLKEIGQITTLPESSLFRILLTLESRGYLKQNPDGSYTLPARLLFGKLQERAEHVRRVVRPWLQKLASRFDETASLAYLYGDRIQALDTVETFHEIRMTNKPGRVLPPHCSSLGKAITASQEPALIDRILETYGLYGRTAKTIVDRQSLLAEFAEIRRRGYAIDREETVLGGVCVGAAIVVEGTPVTSALSVSTPLVRINEAREREIIKAVIETAQLAAQDFRNSNRRLEAAVGNEMVPA